VICHCTQRRKIRQAQRQIFKQFFFSDYFVIVQWNDHENVTTKQHGKKIRLRDFNFRLTLKSILTKSGVNRGCDYFFLFGMSKNS
jgi:hypothetical protein